MPIIVDKIQKRKNIAISCKELFLQSGIDDLTIAKVAQTAGIGKGTIYEYFKNKEDIVFEILSILVIEHDEATEIKLRKIDSTKDKIKEFFSFFYSYETIELREILKEVVSITLTNPNDDMIDFQTSMYHNYHSWLSTIIEDGIKNNELRPNAKDYVGDLFAYAKGMFIMSQTTKVVNDLQSEINRHINIIFEIMELKNANK